jgi:hypothetical protein
MDWQLFKPGEKLVPARYGYYAVWKGAIRHGLAAPELLLWMGAMTPEWVGVRQFLGPLPSPNLFKTKS